MTASIGLLVLTTGCAGSAAPGAVTPTLAASSMTAVGVGTETTVANGIINANTLAARRRAYSFLSPSHSFPRRVTRANGCDAEWLVTDTDNST